MKKVQPIVLMLEFLSVAAALAANKRGATPVRLGCAHKPREDSKLGQTFI
jgi:hypothetical protein